ncbi:MAG: hypothetical protein Q4G71_10925 [Pseudomonadota bacterium]|nr:hypothetical protein [Pseudomonadota bacterium]
MKSAPLAIACALAFCTLLPLDANAQTLPAAAARLLPATHAPTSQRDVRVDGTPARLIRHERRNGVHAGLGGEHFSVLLDERGGLKGFANMSLAVAGQPLSSRERTEAVARAFLQEAAPDLLPRMRISWIEPHDETVRAASGPVTLTGMKLKARNTADGRWFWVIVGADERPLVFERDIVWINMPGRRQTEKWLHDDWLAQQAAPAG